MTPSTFRAALSRALLAGLATIAVLALGSATADAGCSAGEWGPSCLPCPGGSATPCNNNGTCDEGPAGDGTCACDPSWYGEACDTFCSAATTCSGAGVCTSGGTCACNVGVVGASCNQCATNYYNWPTCTFCSAATTCSGAGVCTSGGTCACNVGVTGASCNQCAAGYENWPACTPIATTTTTLPPGDCAPTPLAGCRQSAKSKLLVKDSADDAKDLLVWVWAKGEAFAQAATSDPSTTGIYSLCVYDSVAAVPALALQLQVAPGPSWVDKDPNGWKYKDPAGTSDGAAVVLLKTGADDKTKVMLKALGTGTPLPATVGTKYFSLDSTVTVQLVNSDTGACWATGYTTSKKNDASGFKAVAP